MLLSDPIHLVYFANYWVDPISLGAGFPGYLMIRKDGHAKLLHEDRAPEIDGARPRRGTPRRSRGTTVKRRAMGRASWRCWREVNPMRGGLRIHDRPGDPLAVAARQHHRPDAPPEGSRRDRRCSSTCMRATEAGHAWARANVKPGMTELDVYAGVAAPA